MSNVHRLFIEKKPGFDSYAQKQLVAIQNELGVELSGLRVLLRYDIEGLSDEEFNMVSNGLLSEPSTDEVFVETAELQGAALAIEFLPGQYDARADAAAQTIALMLKCERPRVRCATVYEFIGADEGGLSAIKRYLINPVEAREAAGDKPETLEMPAETPDDVPLVEGFIKLSDDALKEFHSQTGFAMSLADLAFVQKHFIQEDRDPTKTELKVIDTYWSDHCRHTTFLTELESIQVQEGRYKPAIDAALLEYEAERERLYNQERPKTLMDLATISAKALKRAGKLPELDESEEVNACSIKIKANANGKTRDMLVLFKNETHNHPTEIEPFGGASTCLGGAIRDPLSGRAYVYQAMRITGSGDPRAKLEDTLPGKLSQRKITTTAARGYASYGNQIGLTSGQIKEYYHPGFVAKRMELGAVVAAAPEDYVVRERPVPGDRILLIGGRTGRDGCGGATGSSKAHTEDSLTACGAEVQKGDPVLERRIQRLFRNPELTRKIKRCNDFGAGGVSVAIGELADSLLIDLDKVTVKYGGLDGTELAISESQERMAVVVAAGDVDAVLKLADMENLEASVVAEVVDDGYMTMTWRGKTIVRLERAFLNTNGVRQFAKASVLPINRAKDPFRRNGGKDFLQNLSQLNIAANRGLVESFDSTIGRGTLLMPFGGAMQKTPAQAMAALIPMPEGESETATIMAHGFDPELGAWSPFHAGLYAVVESVARLVASGGDYKECYLTMQEYFERLGSDAERWGKPAAALLGAMKAQLALSRAAVGGKDSMSGSFEELDVPPTLVCFAIAPAPATAVTGNEFKRAGSRIALLDILRDEYSMPDFEAMKNNFDKVTDGLRSGSILSATALGRGGIAAAIAKACLGNGLGFSGECAQDAYVPRYGAFILELSEDVEIDGAATIGRTHASNEIYFNSEAHSLMDVEQALFSPLECVFPLKTAGEKAEGARSELYSVRSAKSAVKLANPVALIPVFPGTNGEYDLALAFEKAGAKVETVIIANKTKSHITESYDRLCGAISRANIIALSGGFATDDELPDGAGKVIAAVLSDARVADALNAFIGSDGLMLGIGGGFEALLRTGLLPNGVFNANNSADVALASNAIGRHVSRIVKTRIASVLSPWMANAKAGQIHSVAFSSAQGRLTASEAQVGEWFKSGQIASQYVGENGLPTMEDMYNPSGSVAAIEALSSPDGRILGVIGHYERSGRLTYRNVPGDYDRGLFSAGVAYFS